MVKTLKYKSVPRAGRRLPVASLQRWQAACEAVGAGGNAIIYRQLISAYRSRSRHYHTVTHLEACLRELESARPHLAEPAMVELALWFHDAVYRTFRRDNEERSAQWAREALVKAGATDETAARVASYVLATKHGEAPLTGDMAYVVDIDMAILGEAEPVYDEFEQQVRREYWWVGRKRFVRNRIQLLNSFLSRAAIYATPHFQERYEKPARKNIARSIKQLEQSL